MASGEVMDVGDVEACFRARFYTFVSDQWKLRVIPTVVSCLYSLSALFRTEIEVPLLIRSSLKLRNEAGVN